MSVTPGIDKSRLDVLIYSHDGRGFGHVTVVSAMLVVV
jgi:hypothetical protein